MTITNNNDGDRRISLEPASAGSDVFAGMGLTLLMTAHVARPEPPQNPQPGDQPPAGGAGGAQPAPAAGNDNVPRQGVPQPAQPGQIVQPGNILGGAIQGALRNMANPFAPAERPEPVIRPPVGDASLIPLPVRERVQTLVDRLGSADATVRLRAGQELAQLTQISPRDGEYAALLIQQAMSNPNSPLRQRVDALVHDLDNDRFAVRESAQRDLRAMGPGIAAYVDRIPRANLSLEQRRRLERLGQDLTNDGFENGINLNLFVDRVTRAGLERLNNPALEGTFRNLVRELLTNGDQRSIAALLQGKTLAEMRQLATALQAAFTNERMPAMYVSARMSTAPGGQGQQPTLIISNSEAGEPGTQLRISANGDTYIVNTTAQGDNMNNLNRIFGEGAQVGQPWNFADGLRDLRSIGLIPGFETRQQRMIREMQEWENQRQNMQRQMNQQGIPQPGMNPIGPLLPPVVPPVAPPGGNPAPGAPAVPAAPGGAAPRARGRDNVMV